jgi:hypothetical protein
MRHLLSHEEMGDQRPSQFLRHLKGVAPDVADNVLRTIWASLLPPHVQAILAGQTGGSLDSASHLTDRIFEVTLLPTTASVSRLMPDTSRRTRAYGGAHTPGCLTAGISTRQPLAVQRPPLLAIRRLPPRHSQLPADAPRHLLVPLEIWGRSLKMHPTVLPPAGKLHQRTLTSAPPAPAASSFRTAS